MKDRRFADRAASAIFAAVLPFFILTFSIGLPIYVRAFYFAHIDLLSLPQQSGFSREQIITAYNAVLDYLTIPGREFSVGDLAYSASGASHFADCKILFDLNAAVLIVSSIILGSLLILRKIGKLEPFRIGRYPAAAFSCVLLLAALLLIGAIASIDFDRTFEIFHAIFFPGKDNWMFNNKTDEIIRILPQVFFRNCAIAIAVSTALLSSAIIFFSIKSNKVKSYE